MADVTHQQLLADLKRAFPQREIHTETLRVYLRHVKEIPVDLLAPAIHDLIETSEFFPTVRAIRERVAERVLGLPGEAAALEQVEARQAWARNVPRSPPDAPELNPLVRRAVERVGGWHEFRATDKAAVVRGQFLTIYRELRAQAVLDVQLTTRAALNAPRELTTTQGDTQ